MIYLDTSIALAHLFAEDRSPPESMWREVLVSSRLLEYEVWTRIHARELASSRGEAARMLLGRLAFVELAQPVLRRALEPFPGTVRTLDALHLASVDFLRRQGQDVHIATYDRRMSEIARRLDWPLYEM